MRCNCVEELKKRGYNIKDEQRRWDIYKDTYREAFSAPVNKLI